MSVTTGKRNSYYIQGKIILKSWTREKNIYFFLKSGIEKLYEAAQHIYLSEFVFKGVYVLLLCLTLLIKKRKNYYS